MDRCWMHSLPLPTQSYIKASSVPARTLTGSDRGVMQALSNTVWGYSRLEVQHEPLLDAVAAIAHEKLHLFNGQNIANTVGHTLNCIQPSLLSKKTLQHSMCIWASRLSICCLECLQHSISSRFSAVYNCCYDAAANKFKSAQLLLKLLSHESTQKATLCLDFY